MLDPATASAFWSTCLGSGPQLQPSPTHSTDLHSTSCSTNQCTWQDEVRAHKVRQGSCFHHFRISNKVYSMQGTENQLRGMGQRDMHRFVA